MRYSEIDWSAWKPLETATLMFVRMDGMVLLIRKLKGMGKGLLNGPGGRVDPGETPEQGAIRETQEELRVTPLGVKEAGVLNFRPTPPAFAPPLHGPGTFPASSVHARVGAGCRSMGDVSGA